jgi:hypothetical protein
MRYLVVVAMAVACALPTAAQDHDGNFAKGLDAARRGDYAAAVQAWQPLAERGHPAAQYNLGGMYRHGQGVRQDYVQAFVWLDLATARGLAGATNSRDAVAKLMPAADVAKAQRLARLWTEKLLYVQVAQNEPLKKPETPKPKPAAGSPPCAEDNTEALKLAGANLDGVTLNGSDFSGACLAGAKMNAETTLLSTDLAGADLSGASMRGAKFLISNLAGANLVGADLSGATLNGAILQGAQLCAADLSGVDLTTAVLDESTKLSFRHANLRNTTLPKKLSGADFTGANIKGLKFNGVTKDDRLDLSNAVLLNVVAKDEFTRDASQCGK